MNKLVLALGIAGALLAGCKDDRNGGGDGGNGDGRIENGRFVPTTSNTDATCQIPTGPWGQSPGHLQQPWTIKDCDGNPYALYNDDFCEAKATVVILSAGWCGVCRAEAPSMRADFLEPYADRGVRILQVLQEDNGYDPASGDFCHAWAEQYGLQGYTFMDPQRKISMYSYRQGIDEEPSGSSTLALPVVQIYDATGTLVAMHQGADPGSWTRARATLDELLDASN